MKILILTSRLPFPLKDGGNKAVQNVIDIYMHLGYEVTLLSMNTSRHYVDPATLPESYSKLENLYTVDVNNDISLWGALKSLASGTSYHLSRYLNEGFEATLKDILSTYTFDIIQLEGLYVTPYFDVIQSYTQAPVVYRQHNVEYRIWALKAENEHNIFRKVYVKKLSRQLETYERRFLKKVSYIAPISRLDHDFNLKVNPSISQQYWPFAPEIEHSLPAPDWDGNRPLRLYHIGAMDWLPNREGVQWLINDIFPAVLQHFPDAELYLAGRNMPASFYKHDNPRIRVMGEVADSLAFQADKDVLIVPLKSASGQRIKFIEAMSLSRCIISTDVGRSDIEVEDGKAYLRANSVTDFVAAIKELMRQPGRVGEIGGNAFDVFVKKYSFSSVAGNVKTFANNLKSSL